MPLYQLMTTKVAEPKTERHDDHGAEVLQVANLRAYRSP